MGLYNFQPRFVPFIKAGTKKHTIRDKRKYPDKPGNTLHLYTGLRTKKTRLIARVECVRVDDIVIGHGFGVGSIWINGEELSESERERLARADGFKNMKEMLKFWERPKDRLPFRGNIIHWR